MNVCLCKPFEVWLQEVHSVRVPRGETERLLGNLEYSEDGVKVMVARDRVKRNVAEYKSYKYRNVTKDRTKYKSYKYRKVTKDRTKYKSYMLQKIEQKIEAQ